MFIIQVVGISDFNPVEQKFNFTSYSIWDSSNSYSYFGLKMWIYSICSNQTFTGHAMKLVTIQCPLEVWPEFSVGVDEHGVPPVGSGTSTKPRLQSIATFAPCGGEPPLPWSAIQPCRRLLLLYRMNSSSYPSYLFACALIMPSFLSRLACLCLCMHVPDSWDSTPVAVTELCIQFKCCFPDTCN